MKITLNNNMQNVSLQVGDNAYFSAFDINGHAGSPQLIGEVNEVGGDYIVIDSPVVNITTLDNKDDFIMFSKNTSVNKNSLIGYYAEVKLNNDSTDKIELFSLGSEVTKSSK
jgi:hypothetical protein|tara:strand:- start:10671 stop:11006 length:336 start_codon:yes stop_codon:yes gene_type:complete